MFWNGLECAEKKVRTIFNSRIIKLEVMFRGLLWFYTSSHFLECGVLDVAHIQCSPAWYRRSAAVSYYETKGVWLGISFCFHLCHIPIAFLRLLGHPWLEGKIKSKIVTCLIKLVPLWKSVLEFKSLHFVFKRFKSAFFWIFNRNLAIVHGFWPIRESCYSSTIFLSANNAKHLQLNCRICRNHSNRKKLWMSNVSRFFVRIQRLLLR